MLPWHLVFWLRLPTIVVTGSAGLTLAGGPAFAANPLVFVQLVRTDRPSVVRSAVRRAPR